MVTRIMTPRPQKRPQLSDTQKIIVYDILNEGKAFQASALGGKLGQLTAIRALWRRSYVTPTTRGAISMHTIWKFTDKFFSDFPEFKAQK